MRLLPYCRPSIMGSRGQYDSITQAITAFSERSTWRQAELARRLALGTRALQKILHQLQADGMPLEREEELPNVYWSVPKGWLPSGVQVAPDDWPMLIDALLRAPEGRSRDGLLRKMLQGHSGADGVRRLTEAVETAPIQKRERAVLIELEAALLEGSGLEIRYFSAHAGELECRRVTPARLFLDSPSRVVAMCHRDRCLKWFRLENMQSARRVPASEALSVDSAELRRFLHSSVDGFHDGQSLSLAFVVRRGESRWVKRNLPLGMTVDHEYPPMQGLRVAAAGALEVVARFVVGLGSAAEAETPALRAAVRRLAEGALANHEPVELLPTEQVTSALHLARSLGQREIAE